MHPLLFACQAYLDPGMRADFSFALGLTAFPAAFLATGKWDKHRAAVTEKAR